MTSRPSTAAPILATPEVRPRGFRWARLSTGRYSVRAVMVVMSVVCVILGVARWYVTSEQERIRHKWEVVHALYEKGVGFGSLYPRPFDEMFTWRGCETVDYTVMCTIGLRRNAPRMDADDFTLLVTTFPDIEDLGVMEYTLTRDEFRQLTKLPKLRRLEFFRSPLHEEDVQWITQHRPEIELVYNESGP